MLLPGFRAWFINRTRGAWGKTYLAPIRKLWCRWIFPIARFQADALHDAPSRGHPICGIDGFHISSRIFHRVPFAHIVSQDLTSAIASYVQSALSLLVDDTRAVSSDICFRFARHTAEALRPLLPRPQQRTEFSPRSPTVGDHVTRGLVAALCRSTRRRKHAQRRR